MGHHGHRRGHHHGGDRRCDRVRQQGLRRRCHRRQADRAIHAALEATGGGTADAVERDTENGGFWEVEVRKPDGAVVDVRLNQDYSVLLVEGDNEKADTNDCSGA